MGRNFYPLYGGHHRCHWLSSGQGNKGKEGNKQTYDFGQKFELKNA